MSSNRLKVLFLCTGNSCRSQMAEGWARHLHGELIEASSAGLEAQGLDPLAVEVMAECGVDISGQRSKTLEALPAEERAAIDRVVTVCSEDDRGCPVFPSKAPVVHAPFDDPPALSRGARSREEALAPYRRVRDEIRAFVERLPEVLRCEARGSL
jgi:arsenate reductase